METSHINSFQEAQLLCGHTISMLISFSSVNLARLASNFL